MSADPNRRAGTDRPNWNPESLADDLLDGSYSALARALTHIENRSPGYRELVSALYEHAGSADVIGVTGSPGSGKSTLVDRVTERFRERDLTVGVIAIDPSSPFTGGAVLGDRIRMASMTGDMEVFFRSMSARGSLGGLSAATADAVTALDAFGKDKVIVETVGAGQNEIDIVRAADTVCVLVPPGNGDDVQMLKAGILEIGDLFVVNKADLDGADRTVRELREMIEGRADRLAALEIGEHGTRPNTGATNEPDGRREGADHGDPSGIENAAIGSEEVWTPRIIECVAKTGTGVPEFIEALDAHRSYLLDSGGAEQRVRTRTRESIRTVLREDANAIVERELRARGGLDSFVDQVVAHRSDPYAVSESVLGSLREGVPGGEEPEPDRAESTDQ